MLETTNPKQTAEMLESLKRQLEPMQAEGYRRERAANKARFDADELHQKIFELEQTIAAMEAENNTPQGVKTDADI